ncbi:MAG TPA: ATP-binding cassette domain-containing protein [Gaiellaceae bacterium]
MRDEDASGAARRAVARTSASPVPPAGLLAADSSGVGRLSSVHRGIRRVRIGRDPENDIVVDDVLVSRRHAELVGNPVDGYTLTDVGSHNGTFVNGERVARVELQPLDVVGVGHSQFRLVGDTLEEYVDSGEITFAASGITVVRSGRTLVDGVGLNLHERSLVGIVGPSGSGKSMLVNALSGHRPADSGVVLYDGSDLYAHYGELRYRIGFVPQEDVIQDDLTVEQVLGYSAELRFPPDATPAERRERIDEVLRELALEERRGLPIRRLSGGQRKRVSVAIELLTKPSLLFLDEPTSGLDPGYERSLMELLRALADGGRTVIVITHSIQSLRLCDRVLVLAPGGRTAYFGPAQLAPAYFGREDLQQVFQDLSAHAEIDWPARFREHPDHDRYAGEALPVAEGPAVAPAPAAPADAPRSWWRQLRTLTRRNVAVLASDRRNLALLLLQAPALGLVMLLALPPGQLEPPADGTLRLAAKGGLVLLTIVMGVTWLSASNAAREIARELPIYRRERAVGLSISAYLCSKVAVLGPLTALQAAVLVALATARQRGPVDAVALGSPWLELVVAVSVAGLAGVGLGLLVSALAGRLDRAMTILPVLIVVEMILAMGGIFPEVVEKPGLRQLSYVAGPQWGFAATASTVGLDEIEPLNTLARRTPAIDLAKPTSLTADFADALRGDARWDHTAGSWGASLLALAGLSAVTVAGTGLALRRYDPQRS